MLAGEALARGSAAKPLSSFLGNAAHPADPWAGIAGILARIKPPVFPNRDFEISAYGAEGDNQTDCTDAFAKAIAACYAAGVTAGSIYRRVRRNIVQQHDRAFRIDGLTECPTRRVGVVGLDFMPIERLPGRRRGVVAD